VNEQINGDANDDDDDDDGGFQQVQSLIVSPYSSMQIGSVRGLPHLLRESTTFVRTYHICA
jgi:hypothetical protein